MRQLLPFAAGDADLRQAYDVPRAPRGNRPHLLVNMVASTDGATVVEGVTAKLGSPGDKRVFFLLRSLADVILVGAQTVRAEGYGPPRLAAEAQARRVARGQAALPRIAVVSGSLELDWSSRLFTDSSARPLVLAPRSADQTALRHARAVADVVVAGHGVVDLADALAQLSGRGFAIVLCEGGPRLNAGLAEAGLIDELCLTVSPTLVGGENRPGIIGAAHLPGLIGLELLHVLEEDGFLFLRYGTSRTGEPESPALDKSQAGVDQPEPSAAAGVFNDLAGDLDYPMLIVTAAAGDQQAGCLVGFAAQCSIDPPLFMVWLSKQNHTFQVAMRADALAVHIPSSTDRELAVLFGSETGEAVDKFARCRWHPGPLGVPVLADCPRWFAGRVVDRTDTGDHMGFLLEAQVASTGPWTAQLGFQDVKDIEPGHGA